MVVFPAGFQKRMMHKLGDDWIDFERAHTISSPTAIRINPAKPAPIHTGEKIPWSDFGYYLEERPVFTLDPLFHAGTYYVQEASSMFLEQAVRQHVPDVRGMRVLDLCAAPGGKSTHLLSLLNHDSLLISNEVIRSRVNVLSENIQKWGYPNAVVTNNDPADFAALPGFFDVIVVDAPCSGEGLFRKDPEAMTEWSEENVAVCSQRQQRILHDVWPALKENGLLIYSTCTYNEAENENTLKWITENHNVEFLSLQTQGSDIEEIAFGGALGYRFYPHKVKGEGFFLSIARKLEHESPVTMKPPKNIFARPEKRVREEVMNWVTSPHERFIQRNDLVQLLPELHAETILFLSQRLRMAYSGTFIAAVKHNKLVPEHALALSTLLNRNAFQQTSLDQPEALQYLKKETLNIQTDRKGFSLALCNDIPIGWMNLLPGRINNLYPQEWRIRMR